MLNVNSTIRAEKKYITATQIVSLRVRTDHPPLKPKWTQTTCTTQQCVCVGLAESRVDALGQMGRNLQAQECEKTENNAGGLRARAVLKSGEPTCTLHPS